MRTPVSLAALRREWRVAGLSILALVVGSLLLMTGTSSAQAAKHYRAEFVAESSLPASGKAEITVDANGVAHIVIQLRGLLAGQTYPAHIHEGASIAEPGQILVALPDLVANRAGVATLVTTLPGADALNLADRTIGVHLPDGIRIAKGEIN